MEPTTNLDTLYLRKLQADRAYLDALRLVYEPRFMAETATHVVDRDDFCYATFFGDKAVQTRKDAVLLHKLMRASYPSDVAGGLTNAYCAESMGFLRDAEAFLEQHGTLDGWKKLTANDFDAFPDHDDIEMLKTYNMRVMCSLWYRWYFNEGIQTGQKELHRVFVSPDVLAQRQAERAEDQRKKEEARMSRADAVAAYEAIAAECDRDIQCADAAVLHGSPVDETDLSVFVEASRRSTDTMIAAMRRKTEAFYKLYNLPLQRLQETQ